MCMARRGPWICSALSKLAIPEFRNDQTVTPLPLTAVQEIAHHRIVEALRRGGNPDPDLGPEKCVSEMLRGESLYNELPNNLCLYDPSKLKVLHSKLNPQPLEQRLPTHAKVLYERFSSYIEKTAEQVDQEFSDNMPAAPVPYWDPILKANKTMRRQFLARLSRVGLLGFRKRVKARVGIFFVRKKNPHEIRMIIDARLANRVHHKPPTTRLGAGSCYVDLDLSSENLGNYNPNDNVPIGSLGEEGYAQEADVSDCFYNFTTDPLSSWFGVDVDFFGGGLRANL